MINAESDGIYEFKLSLFSLRLHASKTVLRTIPKNNFFFFRIKIFLFFYLCTTTNLLGFLKVYKIHDLTIFHLDSLPKAEDV